MPGPPGQYISYTKQSIKVYHCGEHTCPDIKSIEKNTQHIKMLLCNNPSIKPSEIQLANVELFCQWCWSFNLKKTINIEFDLFF